MNQCREGWGGKEKTTNRQAGWKALPLRERRDEQLLAQPGLPLAAKHVQPTPEATTGKTRQTNKVCKVKLERVVFMCASPHENSTKV